MYTSIVVPLDGSEFGKRAIPVALALASRSEAAVHLVHVQEHVALPQGAPMYDTRLDHESAHALRAGLTALAVELARGTTLQVDTHFLDGPVVPTMQRYLRESQHDLVVMMTHGRGGISRAWLGSVADGLIRHAPVPLLLLRQETAWLSEAREPLFRRILVPLDGSALADSVLDHIVSLATTDITVYVLLTVTSPYSPLEYAGADIDPLSGRSHEELQREAALAYLDSVADELRSSGALVEVLVESHHHAAHGILAVASEHTVDLIALSTHGRGSVGRLIHGSVADKVVRGATVPVLVYRPEPTSAEPSAYGRDAVMDLPVSHSSHGVTVDTVSRTST